VKPFIFAIWHPTYCGVSAEERVHLIMNSQEELARCLRQLTVALAPNHARRLSIVQDGAKPRVASAEEGVRRSIVRCKQADPHAAGNEWLGSDPVNETIFPRPRSRAETDA